MSIDYSLSRYYRIPQHDNIVVEIEKEITEIRKFRIGIDKDNNKYCSYCPNKNYDDIGYCNLFKKKLRLVEDQSVYYNVRCADCVKATRGKL